MRKIIQAVASVAILAASMVHAAPSFAVMAPPDMDNPCMQYGCTIPPLVTVYDPHQTQTGTKWKGMIY